MRPRKTRKYALLMQKVIQQLSSRFKLAVSQIEVIFPLFQRQTKTQDYIFSLVEMH
jgi:hypothetical protein